MQTGNDPDSTPLPERLEQFEREQIRVTLIATGGNIFATAERLGVLTTRIYRKMRRFGWIERGPIDRPALLRRLVALGESAEG